MTTSDFSDNCWEEIPNTPYLFASKPLNYPVGNSTVHLCKTAKHSPFHPPLLIKFFKSPEKPNKIISDLIGLRMKHVVEFYDLSFQNPEFVIMELGGKNLRHPTIWKSFRHSAEETLELATQLLYGLKQLKHQGIIHCDVKPQNIIYCQNGIYKWCDLDFSMTEKEASQSIRVGTLQYMAPEVLEKGQCSYQSDIWSLGILLFELYFGHIPWHKTSLDCEQFSSKIFLEYHQIIKRELGKIKEELAQRIQICSQQTTILLLNLISSCLVFDPTKRKTTEDLFLMSSRKKPRKSSFQIWIENISKDECHLSQELKISILKQLTRLQQNFESLPSNDLLIRKASTLLSLTENIKNRLISQENLILNNLIGEINKITLESRKISELIKANIKRLGTTPVTGVLKQKAELAQFLEVTNSYLLQLNKNQVTSQNKSPNWSADTLPQK